MGYLSSTNRWTPLCYFIVSPIYTEQGFRKGQFKEALLAVEQAKVAVPETELENWDQFIADIEEELKE